MSLTLSQSIFLESLDDDNALAKSIANYMFREVIEDAHAKYKISQEDMKIMCKKAVNRAAALLDTIEKGLYEDSLTAYSYDTRDWDAPDEKQVRLYSSFFDQVADEIDSLYSEQPTITDEQ